MDDQHRAAAGIAEDLEFASAAAQLTFHIRAMIESRSPLTRLADDFIWFAMRSCRDAAVVHLWKAFDTQKGARSLPWFIRTYSGLSESERTVDIERLSTSSDDVRRLARLRHQIFAHRGSEQASAGSATILEMNNLSEAEFRHLVSSANKILRRHTGTHVFRQLMHIARDAVDQLIDLDVYLTGTYRGMTGIERLHHGLPAWMADLEDDNEE